MNDAQSRMLLEVHTAVCGRGGLHDRVDKNSSDIEDLKKFRWGFGSVITILSAALASFVTNLFRGDR